MIFPKAITDNAVGYCIFHDGFIRNVDVQNRECLKKDCQFCVLFRERTAERQPRHVQLYTGDPHEFLTKYAALIELKRPHERAAEDEEPDGEWIDAPEVMSMGEIREAARYADRRRRKNGKKGGTHWKRRGETFHKGL